MRSLKPVSLEVDQNKINLYADITDDWNPLHTAPEFAAGTEMKGVIAHGTMSVNLIWQALTASFGLEAAGGATLDIRFLRPVRVGDMVTAGGGIDDDDPSLWRVWVRNQRGEEVVGGTARFRVDS